MPELDYFSINDRTVAWSLPLLITIGLYIATRYKFYYLGDGDLVFNFNVWAK